MIYQLIMYPIECVYKVLYLTLSELLSNNYGLALVFLSIVTCVLMRPLMSYAEKFQADEKNIQSILAPQLATIKENFSGAEQHKKIQRLYKRYAYHPTMAIRSAAGIIVQLPFLTAAYFMLDKLTDIIGQSWWLIDDLSSPDALLGGVNFLPFLMTVINIVGAFFVKDFSRRDKIQASVIAILFLILLYDASSALLIYWTCNNLWTTISILIKPIMSKTKRLDFAQVRLKNFLSAELIPLGFSITLFIFIPLDVYLANAEEIWFSAKDIFPYLLIGATLSFILLCFVEKFLPANPRKLFQVILFGFTILFFLQSYLLNPDYTIIELVQTEDNTQENLLNLIVWAYFLFLIVYLAKKHSAEKFLGVGKTLCLMLVAVQIFSLCLLSANSSVEKRDYNILTTANLLDVSSKENIIVLILDAFDSRTFTEILQNEPEIVAPFEGFTFYPDAISIFHGTDWSVPQMLTGKVWDNSQPYSEYVQEAWDSDSCKRFYNILQEHNYDISVYTRFCHVPQNAPVDNLLSQSLSINYYTLSALAKLTLFRCMPNCFKQNFSVDSSALLQQEKMSGEIQPYSDDNYLFYSELQKGLTLHDDKNSFRWYHIDGAHFPFMMTRDIEPVPNGEETTRYEQSIGALKIASTYLQQMKDLGIYDNATILILSDHGDHRNLFQDLKSFAEVKALFTNNNKPLPLVLVKQPNEHGKLKVSENPISYFQLQATILKRFPEATEFGEDFYTQSKKERIFRLMNPAFDHTVTEYVVAPQAWNNSSWHEVRTLYRSYVTSQNYKIGTVLTSKNVEQYMTSGWRILISINSFFTEGEKSEMCFHIKKLEPDKDLKITALAWQNPSIETDSREVDVYVNGTFVTTWDIDKHSVKIYEAIIPHGLLKDTNLELSFKIKPPILVDTIGFYRLVINYNDE